MLSIGLMSDDWRSDTGGLYLRLFLIAGLGAPLIAAATGRHLATPFGIPAVQLAGIMVAGLLGYSAWRMRRSPRRGLMRVVTDAVALLALAVSFALIIERSANGFYTQEVLADALAVLLLLHLAGAMLRGVGRSRQRWPPVTVLSSDGVPAIPRRSNPASMQFADALTAGMAVLVVCFWGFALIGFHEAAGILLIFAGALGAVVVLVRLPSVFFNERVLFRDWRRQRRSRRSTRSIGNEAHHVDGS